jgi:hypothetical protein
MASIGARLKAIMEDYIILKPRLDSTTTTGGIATCGAHEEALMYDFRLLQQRLDYSQTNYGQNDP